MQAKLPDINAAFVKYRTNALESIRAENYNGSVGALNNINALFPDEYRVKISQIEYDKAIEDKIFYVCTGCKVETPYHDITINTIKHNLIMEVLTSNKIVDVWECPKCNDSNPLTSTQIITERFSEPNYNKVVAPCPVRNNGLRERLGFHQRFSAWFYRYLEELEYQLGLYRIEYASQAEAEETIEYAPGEE